MNLLLLMKVILFYVFLIYSPIKRTLELSDDEDDSLKKSKNPDELSTLE